MHRRVFVDRRRRRAEQIEILRLAMDDLLWPDSDLRTRVGTELSERYNVSVYEAGVVPKWVASNVMPQGAPASDEHIDLDALANDLVGRRSTKPS